MALKINVKVILPLTRARGSGFKPGHRNTVGLERRQNVVHRSRSVVYRHDQADAVFARSRGRRQRLRQANHGKPRAVERVVLNRMSRNMQAKFGARSLASDARPGRVACRKPGAFGIA